MRIASLHNNADIHIQMNLQNYSLNFSLYFNIIDNTHLRLREYCKKGVEKNLKAENWEKTCEIKGKYSHCN